MLDLVHAELQGLEENCCGQCPHQHEDVFQHQNWRHILQSNEEKSIFSPSEEDFGHDSIDLEV